MAPIQETSSFGWPKSGVDSCWFCKRISGILMSVWYSFVSIGIAKIRKAGHRRVYCVRNYILLFLLTATNIAIFYFCNAQIGKIFIIK